MVWMKKMTEPNGQQLEDFKKLQLITYEAEKVAELAFRQKLLNIYAEARQDKETISSDWNTFIAFLRGQQWPKRRPSYKVSAVINFLIENIERKTALLSDAKPIPNIKPRNDKLQDTADILNTIINSIFENSSFGQANTDLVENSQVFGSGFIGTLFDADGDNHGGDVSVVSYDPRAVYVDPLVRKSYLLHEAEYVIIEDIWPLTKAKDMYPERADMFKADAGLERFRDDKQGFFATMRNKIFKSPQDEVVKSEIPRVYVREFWLKDRSVGENDKPRFKNKARKVCMVGEVIADDGDNPYNDGMHPIDMLIWHTDFNTSWGWGDVELLRNPQELQNKIIATVIENISLMSNAIWIGDTDALEKQDWNKLNNEPGTYVKKRIGRELRREPGMPLPEYVLRTLDYVGISTEKISGMVDVMRGIRTGQVSSGVGIESLQLMAQALIRLRARALEALHERVGRKLVSRIFQFYPPKKIMDVLMETNRDVTQLEAITSELLKDISERKGDEWTNISFKIEPGSSLGLAQTQRRIESMKLREMQVIDNRALLEDLEYPHRETVLKRTEEKLTDAGEAEMGAGDASRGTRFPVQEGASPVGRT